MGREGSASVKCVFVVVACLSLIIEHVEGRVLTSSSVGAAAGPDRVSSSNKPNALSLSKLTHNFSSPHLTRTTGSPRSILQSTRRQIKAAILQRIHWLRQKALKRSRTTANDGGRRRSANHFRARRFQL